VTIRKNCTLGVGDAFDNLANGQHAGSVRLHRRDESVRGGTVRTSDFARYVFETALKKYEAYGEHLTGLAAHRHSHTALRIHQHCNRCFGHLALTVARGLGMDEGYCDTVEIFLERDGNATLGVAAEILGLPAASLPHNTRSEVFLPVRFGMGVGDLVALADAAHVGAAGLVVGSAIRFLATQDARLCGDTHDDVPMEPTMYGWLATAMITAVSRRPSASGGDGDDNEPMHVVVRARFGLGALGCHVRFSCTRRVRTPHNHNVSDASPKTTVGGSRRLCSQSRMKQRTNYLVP
jgi:hypothetical protein